MMRESFEGLKDARQQARVQYDLYEIIAMTITAVIGNCDSWDEIEDFGIAHEEWLKKRVGLKLENGIPSADTIARVWGMIDPDGFKKCFNNWIGQIHRKLTGEVISIDGKTLRGSGSPESKPIHMVSAWVSEQQLVLAQASVSEKTNEIPVVPQLLDLLDIKGCIVTADAMNCQRETVKKIIDGKGDYVLGLKENQPKLYEYAATYFEDILKNPSLYPEIKTTKTVEKGHGRIETRSYYLATDLSGLDTAKQWAGIAALGMVRSHVQYSDHETVEQRYAVTSLNDISAFSSAWRSHWGIENSLHYCLDVSFNEDRSRIRKDHAPDNLAVVRHFALSALKQVHYKNNASIRRKRKVCSYDLDLLASALSFILL